VEELGPQADAAVAAIAMTVFCSVARARGQRCTLAARYGRSVGARESDADSPIADLPVAGAAAPS
jgi:hypothetical protein